MPIRITFDPQGHVAAGPAVRAPRSVRAPRHRAPHRGPDVALLDWTSTGRQLLLHLRDEPAIGLRFRYNGLAWEIVDYRDGWIARLLTE